MLAMNVPQVIIVLEKLTCIIHAPSEHIVLPERQTLLRVRLGFIVLSTPAALSCALKTTSVPLVLLYLSHVTGELIAPMVQHIRTCAHWVTKLLTRATLRWVF